ncbi:MAG TPA: hypothetical protein VIK01_08670 [Polyangiaceae bacterium]
MLGCAVVGALSSTAFLKAIAFATVGVGLIVVAWGVQARRAHARQQLLEHEARERTLVEEQHARELAAAQEEEHRKERYAALETRFGIDVAQAILKHEYWQGATVDMITESLGEPADVKQRIYKTKTKATYCYKPIGVKRYALRIHFENGAVVGWDEK